MEVIAFCAVALLGVGALVAKAAGGCIFCRDGWQSGSSGGRGTCSHHGGIADD
jgi:hypothetical protein